MLRGCLDVPPLLPPPLLLLPPPLPLLLLLGPALWSMPSWARYWFRTCPEDRGRIGCVPEDEDPQACALLLLAGLPGPDLLDPSPPPPVLLLWLVAEVPDTSTPARRGLVPASLSPREDPAAVDDDDGDDFCCLAA